MDLFHYNHTPKVFLVPLILISMFIHMHLLFYTNKGCYQNIYFNGDFPILLTLYLDTRICRIDLTFRNIRYYKYGADLWNQRFLRHILHAFIFL